MPSELIPARKGHCCTKHSLPSAQGAALAGPDLTEAQLSILAGLTQPLTLQFSCIQVFQGEGHRAVLNASFSSSELLLWVPFAFLQPGRSSLTTTLPDQSAITKMHGIGCLPPRDVQREEGSLCQSVPGGCKRADMLLSPKNHHV